MIRRHMIFRPARSTRGAQLNSFTSSTEKARAQVPARKGFRDLSREDFHKKEDNPGWNGSEERGNVSLSAPSMLHGDIFSEVRRLFVERPPASTVRLTEDELFSEIKGEVETFLLVHNVAHAITCAFKCQLHPSFTTTKARSGGLDHMVNELFVPIITHCLNQKKYNLGIRTLNTLQSRGIKLNARNLNFMIELLVLTGKGPQALSTFERVKSAGIAPSIGAYVSLLNYLHSSIPFDFAKSETLIEDMRINCTEWTTPAYDIVMTIYSSKRMKNKVLEYYHKMLSSGLPPTAQSFRPILKECLDSNDLETARNCFSRMRSHLDSFDIRLYGIMIDLFLRNNDLKAAKSLTAEIQEKGQHLNAVIYTLFINHYSNNNLLDEAVEIIAEMKSCGIKPSDVTIGSILKVYSQLGDIDAARRIFDEMKSSGEAPNAIMYGTLINMYAKRKQKAEAYTLLSEMRSNKVKPTIQCFVPILQMHLDLNNDFGENDQLAVLQLFETMKSNNIQGNAYVYNELIYFYSIKMRSDLAMQSYRDMLAAGIKPTLHIFATLIKMYSSSFNIERAVEVLEDMKKHGLEPDHAIHNIIARMFYKSDNRPRLLNYMATLPNKSASIVVYNLMLSACLKEKDVAGARSVLQLITEAKVKKDLITYNLEFQVDLLENDTDRALQTVKTMQKDGLDLDIFSYNIFIAHFLRRGDVNSAVRILHSMLEKNIRPDAYTFEALIQYYVKAGDLVQAQRYNKVMLREGLTPTRAIQSLKLVP